ncbi:MAG: glycerol kinase GlpK [Gammaproteobacteria bacterium]|nr:glycerol kinase GlpK [Gammaproteobacteria bacterium]
MAYLLALDQGTTSSRAIVFDGAGVPIAVAQREFPQIYPAPGWVEHDPETLWRSQSEVAVDALAGAGIRARDVAALGIANQRETTLLWDRRTGAAVAPAIVWQDRRTADRCAALRAAGREGEIRKRSGLVLDPYFSATKLGWLLDADAGLRARAAAGELAFGTVDTWLAWKLTGGALHVTDASNASRTLLCDLHTGDWSDALLAAFDVPRAILPRIVDSSGVLGTVTSVPGLAGISIAALVGDQQGALAGQACFAPGLAKNTYGTGCFLLMHTGTEAHIPPGGLLSTIACRRAGRLTYALEGGVFVGGAVVQWLRDGLGLVRESGEVETLAASVPDSGGVAFVPAFTGLGAPHWDPYARGAIFGLTRGTTAAHLARAALESIALQVTDLVTALESGAGFALAELRVDGGAAANDLLLQLQADLLARPVVRPVVTETTALGAAWLAGLATGVWCDEAELAHLWRAERRFEPRMPAADAESLRQRWQEAVSRSRGWIPA